jgi:hypothetical protein
VNHKVDSVALVVNQYVEYKKDDKEFIDYLKKQGEQSDAKQRTANKGSESKQLGNIPQK